MELLWHKLPNLIRTIQLRKKFAVLKEIFVKEMEATDSVGLKTDLTLESPGELILRNHGLPLLAKLEQ